MVLRSARRRGLVAALVGLLVAVAGGQGRQLTVEELYSYEGWTRFNGSQWATLNWVPDDGPWLDAAHHLWPAAESSGASWLRVDAATGVSQPWFTDTQLEAALTSAGAPPAEARTVARRRPSNFNTRHDAFLMTIADDLYVYEIAAERASRLTRSSGAKAEATFSPDGRQVPFVKHNNLFVTRLDAPEEKALTSDGTDTLVNGLLDWVYSEEL